MFTLRCDVAKVRNVVCIAIALLVLLTAAPSRGDLLAPLFTLTASDGYHRDGFGLSIAVSGDIAVIGATETRRPTQNFGSAYLFDVKTGKQLNKLTPASPAAGNRFGYSVAIRGDTALVGAIKDPDPGAAYVFDVNSGQQLAELVGSDAHSGDYFGSSVALTADRAVVGAIHGGPGFWCGFGCLNHAGAAYVFDVATGQQLFKLTPSDPQSTDNFGSTIAVSGDKAIIGAWGNRQQGVHGAAYIFDLNTGQQLLKLTAPPHPGDAFDSNFGYSVALDGNVALVGAREGLDADTYDRIGSAYLFDVTTGQQLLRITPSDGIQNDGFGHSVALNESFALVGAVRVTPFAQNLFGKAYLFDRSTGQELAKLEYAECYGDCGYSVALTGDTALISTPFNYEQGRVYVFRTAPEPASIWLVAFGFAVLATFARKKLR